MSQVSVDIYGDGRMSENQPMPVLTPMDVELVLRQVSKDLTAAQTENAEIEMSYSTNKAELEIAMAKSRLSLANQSKPGGKNYTVDERSDHATVENEELVRTVAIDEARVKASRGRINMLITKADIGRSLSSSVKASMKE
jgi:hypothetical protein